MGDLVSVKRGSVGNSQLSSYQCQNAACSNDFFFSGGQTVLWRVTF